VEHGLWRSVGQYFVTLLLIFSPVFLSSSTSYTTIDEADVYRHLQRITRTNSHSKTFFFLKYTAHTDITRLSVLTEQERHTETKYCSLARDLLQTDGHVICRQLFAMVTQNCITRMLNLTHTKCVCVQYTGEGEFLATDQKVPGSIPGATRFSEK
jgi:hypothetical protein